MVPGRLYRSLFLPTLREHMGALFAEAAFLGTPLRHIDGRSRDSLCKCTQLLFSYRLLGIAKPVPNRSQVDRISVILVNITHQARICFSDKETKSKVNGKERLLFVDSHPAHITTEFLQYCLDNGIKA